MNALAGKIEELIKIAFDGGYDEADYYRWTERVTQFLSKAFNSETAFAFDSIANEDWTHRRAAQVGMLEGLVQRQGSS